MRILDNLKKVFNIKKNVDENFVTMQDEQDFEKSIYGKIQLYNSKLYYIEEMLPIEGNDLRKQIQLFTNILEKTGRDPDDEFLELFGKFEKRFQEDKKIADGEYTIAAFKEYIKQIQSSFDNCEVDKEKFDRYFGYIKETQKKIGNNDFNKDTNLTDTQKQKFNMLLMKAEYLMKMLELMYLQQIGEVDINPFRNLSSLKQKLFSSFFYDDAKKVSNDYNNISENDVMECSESVKEIYFDLEGLADRLDMQIVKARAVEDTSISQLFNSENPLLDSFTFLKEFLDFKKKIFTVKKDIKIQKMEKMEEQQRLKKLSEMSNEDIDCEIDRISHEIFIEGSRFNKIIDFQKDVALSKGLISSVEDENTTCKIVDEYDAYRIVNKANNSGKTLVIFPDCQESHGKKMKVVVRKGDEDLFDLPKEENPFRKNVAIKGKSFTFGPVPICVLNFIKEYVEDNKNYIMAYENENGQYMVKFFDGFFGKWSKSEVNQVSNHVMDEVLKMGLICDEMKDVLPYVKVHHTTNMIRLLEKFKEDGIPAYLERTESNGEYIQIYFKREHLKKVENEISYDAYYNIAWGKNETFGRAIKRKASFKVQENEK